ncbi:hypothetical protein N7466_001246 [Penicillium verhagenii]|uniref:uncharacterized protein n=1 Tax=Penicillium verhagenii TaxID=1562060 RepID=UPI002545139D|nr:uncharacterized protein N7466_001246 [Penicillium verhagenii]KAJ5948231.1 hypothetical protein N7466_001246 [Penicillium verhagenii]
MAPTPSLEEFQVGWICALPIEAAAAEEMLDEEFDAIQEQDKADTNIYTLAATVATNMLRTFSKSLRIGLMVGIGGGIPSPKSDIRLGDIVISYPSGTCGRVIQHDMLKIEGEGKLHRTGSLNRPPRLLLGAVDKIKTQMLRHDPLYLSYIEEALQKNKRVRMNFGPTKQESDRLFQAHHEHPSNAQSCNDCPTEWEVPRNVREDDEPQLHYGIIASGNAVVKHAETRDRLGADSGALCFEMESAGLMNKEWQGYAALAAAAYAKELLGHVPTAQLSQERLAGSICKLVEEIQEIKTDTKKIDQKIDLGRLEIAKGALFDSFENRMHDECLDGTRVELLQEVEGWIDLPQGKSMFWLNGMAGTGKSTISRTLATRLSQRRELGGSFFFKRGEEDRGNPKRLFTTLAQQLLNSIPELIDGIKRAIEEDPYISEKALGEQFDKLILQPVLAVKLDRTIKRVIVIDALDECESNNSEDIRIILALLSQLQKSTSVQLRFFLTSRPELPIRLGFDKIQGKHQNLDLHKVQASEITRDLALFLEHKFSKICDDRGLPPTWPGEAALQVLLARTVPLFISAATLCRFIGDSSWDPNKRLMMILTDRFAYVSKLESTYLPVLTQLLLGQDKWETQQLIEEFKNIVGVIIVVATPLSVDTISQLVDTPVSDITQRLDRLHSVLNVPKDKSIPVRLLHLSFRDFLSDQKTKESEASAKFWIDEREMHQLLASKCLKTMSKSLKRNICNLPTYGTARSEIDLHCKSRCIPQALRYACHYWEYHVMQSKGNKSTIPESTVQAIYSFLTVHFLHWVEVMIILGLGSEVTKIVDRLQTILKVRFPICDFTHGYIYTNTSQDVPTSKFLKEAKQFLSANRQVCDTTPLQLYYSGLVFAPRMATMRKLFQKELPKWISRFPEVEENWSTHLQTFEGHTDSVVSVAFSPSGQLLASCSDDETVNLWDSSTGMLQQSFKNGSYSVAFSPDRRLLASGSDEAIHIWDTATGILEKTLDGYSSSVVFSPDGRLLASSSGESIVLWDVATSTVRKTFEDCSSPVVFSPNGRLLSSLSDDCLCFWDIDTGEIHATIDCPSESVTFLSDGKLIAFASDNDVQLWDITTGILQLTFEGHTDRVLSVAFSTNGLLASGSRDESVRLWDIATGISQVLRGHAEWVKSVAFSPNGQNLASGSNDSTIRLWDTPTGKLQQIQSPNQHSGWVISAVFSHNGELLATSSIDETVRLWDTSKGSLLHIFDGHSNLGAGLTFSPDNSMLAFCCDDGSTWLWNTASGNLHHTLQGPSDYISFLVFSFDGTLLAVVPRNNTIQLWDTVSGELQRTFMEHPHNSVITAVAFSPSSFSVVSGSTHRDPIVWDTSNRSSIVSLQGHHDGIQSVSFSPDGRLVASGSWDCTIIIWQSATGSFLWRLKGHSDVIRLLLFPPDGKELVSTSTDGTVRLWNVGTGQLVHTVHTNGLADRVEFSDDLLHLKTNLGSISIPSKYDGVTTSAKKTAEIRLEETVWVSLHGKRSLWLPLEYRASCSKVRDNCLVVGTSSGRVLFMDFILD